jgi:DNA-binding HxlR family transcriptional regulator
MSEKCNRRWVDDPAIVQRAVILQILAEDSEKRWSAAELRRELYNIEPHALHNALIMLEHAGVLERAVETVYASRAARRLDEMGLIAV